MRMYADHNSGIQSITNVVTHMNNKQLICLSLGMCTSQAQPARQESAPAAAPPKLAPPMNPASAAGMPPGWGQASDPSSGRAYYFNSVTGAQYVSLQHTASSPDTQIRPPPLRSLVCGAHASSTSTGAVPIDAVLGIADMN